MPIVEVFITASIVAAFIIFAVVFAWEEPQTRKLPRPGQARPAVKR